MRYKILLVLMLLASGLAVVNAHRPGTIKATTSVSNPYVSWVFAGIFEKGDEVFVLKMDMERAFAMPFEIFVPRQEIFRDFRPRYAIVGPGLPKPSRLTQALLPKPVPKGMGVFYEANDKPTREVFFETVMRRAMWSSGTIAIPLQKGKYEVWMWSPDGDIGKFQFAFGVEEKFDDGAFDSIFEDWGLYAY